MKFGIPLFLLVITFSCQAQNGPTLPSVVLTWSQSPTATVTANCVYRGTSPGIYKLPALFCSSTPITTYTDSSVTRGTGYDYAVTAQAAGVESIYSGDLAIAIPLAPQPPTQLKPQQITENRDGKTPQNLSARVVWRKADHGN